MSGQIEELTERKTEIIRLLKAYDLGELLEVKRVAQGYANENLLVVTTDRKVLYRICKQQPLHLIEYEVRLMQALKDHKIKTAFPIADTQGNYIQKLGDYYAMFYDFVVGYEPVLIPEISKQMGIEIGRLSTVPMTPSLAKKNAVHIDNCHKLISEFEDCQNPLEEVFSYFKEQTAYLSERLDESLPVGIVHGDAFPNNTIFNINELQAIIDFEEACSDQLMFDVGMTINGFCFVNNQLQKDLLEAFLAGYNAQRKMTDEEWAALPIYVQWGSHGMLSWHLRNDLINTHRQVQYERVLELMKRTQWIRSNEEQIQKLAKGFVNK